MVPLSVLDLSPIVEGATASQALRNSLELAQHAERLGFTRFWLAEHHNFPGVASAATAVVIAHLAGGTSRIRLGAGGIMLPNHAPYVIAEQFGTLEALFPGRIDLGLGRAPGSDLLAQHALRRDPRSADRFAEDVGELMHWFRDDPGAQVQAVPGAGAQVPLWILGSSLFGAQLAARFGLPFSFASHFAPAQLDEAVRLYRAQFRPSAQQPEPRVMLGLNVIAADSDDEARYLFSSIEQAFVALRRGRPRKLPAPVRDLEPRLSAEERALLRHALQCSVVGSRETVQRGLSDFVARTGADEVILTCQLFEHEKRLRSLTLTQEAAGAC
ncbi:MAG: LLM class flavin-dependent oxidoreductase [Myxococcales bacterium]